MRQRDASIEDQLRRCRERTTVADEAEMVRRIVCDYAAGRRPKAVAFDLNPEGASPAQSAAPVWSAAFPSAILAAPLPCTSAPPPPHPRGP